MSNSEIIPMHEFLICGTESYLKMIFNYEPKFLIDEKYN